jgi:hypothetical protein
MQRNIVGCGPLCWSLRSPGLRSARGCYEEWTVKATNTVAAARWEQRQDCDFFPHLTLAGTTTLARAQDNYEIQVDGSDLVDPGPTIVELHSNFTIDGSKTIVDGVYPPITLSMRPSFGDNLA